MQSVRVFVRTSLFLLGTLILSAAAVSAAQTGTMQGKITDSSGGVLPGVTVEAKSNVLPTARTTQSSAESARATG